MLTRMPAATGTLRRQRRASAQALRFTAGTWLLLVSVAQPFDCTFEDSYPRQYVAYKTDHPLVVDGALDDPAWLEVPWTEDFVDISTDTAPHFRTQAKVRYDSTFLYVGARLSDTAVWANISTTCHCEF